MDVFISHFDAIDWRWSHNEPPNSCNKNILRKNYTEEKKNKQSYRIDDDFKDFTAMANRNKIARIAASKLKDCAQFSVVSTDVPDFLFYLNVDISDFCHNDTIFEKNTRRRLSYRCERFMRQHSKFQYQTDTIFRYATALFLANFLVKLSKLFASSSKRKSKHSPFRRVCVCGNCEDIELWEYERRWMYRHVNSM